ncbi:MAG: glycine zipper 2TM domain-containing protein [Pseudomonadota bacterium]|nr:glycine zipper 2TM domain-containing protein [Pseudomonadota bacterium]
MNNNTLAIALAALLVGGVAVAAFNNNRDGFGPGGLEYATVLDVEPVTEKQELYAQVLGSEPVRETSTTTTPREVCNDVVVSERMPERDGNVGGTVAGAIIGGLVGNQIGGGNGKKLATAGGAVAGGMIGNRVDRNHVGGQVVNRTQRDCHTTTSTSETSKIVAYKVTYRNPDGTTGMMRTDEKPGETIALGTEDVPVAYDVTYEYDGQERTVRLPERPLDGRLPVVDGEVVTQVAAVPGTDRQ